MYTQEIDQEELGDMNIPSAPHVIPLWLTEEASIIRILRSIRTANA